MPKGTGGIFGGHTSNGRVLIVDDEPDVRKVIKTTLTKAGYDVIEAEDGEKAIAAPFWPQTKHTGQRALSLGRRRPR